jgi:TPR repeat protein
MEYFHGTIVSPDFSQALAWLQRAADNGYTAAERGFFADEICELTQP